MNELRDPSKPLVSVVAPFFNEQETIAIMHGRLREALDRLSDCEFEFIFVDDGSVDRTLEALKMARDSDPRVKIVSFSRNFGHQTAFTAGLHFARGRAVVLMDGDLQDPPEFIPTLLEKWRQGWDVVYAVRRRRKEGALLRLAYSLFYRLLQRLSQINIPLDTGDFCAMDRRVVDQLNLLPERNRFLRGIRSWVGFRQTGVEYERDKRHAGEVKYTFRKLLRLAFDGVMAFSYVPLQVATLFGSLVSVVSFFWIFVILFQKFILKNTVPGFATTVILVLFLGGLQLLTIGIVGEYIGRIYDEVKRRPQYVTKEIVGFDPLD